MVRAAALLVTLTALGVYYGISEELPGLSQWGDVAFLALGLMPATFLLVWLALPLRTSGMRWLGIAALALVAATVLLEQVDLDIAANFVKLAAAVAVGWWFLGFFEALSWVLLVALLIVPVDAFSVFRGPTKEIVENQPEVFNALSVAFPLPGEHATAQLGLPDVLFFSLFLGAAEHFGLRVAWTWAAMTLSFGTTLALAVAFDVSGLPALPLLSVAFVLVNADLIWRAYRTRQLNITLRKAGPEDLPFLREMVAWAANWRSDRLDPEAVADPAISRYVEGFGREGDTGVIAEDERGRPIGAAWYRYFSADEPGFGFVAPEVPEVTIGVPPKSREQGVGAALLKALVDRARSEGVSALSLSVEDGNRAVRLYERTGFRPVGRHGNAVTMRLEIPVRSD